MKAHEVKDLYLRAIKGEAPSAEQAARLADVVDTLLSDFDADDIDDLAGEHKSLVESKTELETSLAEADEERDKAQDSEKEAEARSDKLEDDLEEEREKTAALKARVEKLEALMAVSRGKRAPLKKTTGRKENEND